jgi:hypothetical protein
MASDKQYQPALPEKEVEQLYKCWKDKLKYPGAKAAYDRLCAKCDPIQLSLCLSTLTDDAFKRLDSWDTAADGLTPKEARAIAKRAVRLRDDILRLQKTPLVRDLVHKGMILKGDLLYSLLGRGPIEASFAGLANLPKLVRKATIGPRYKPDFNQSLDDLMAYVSESGGTIEDLATVLTALDHNFDGPALRQRSYHRRQSNTTQNSST